MFCTFWTKFVWAGREFPPLEPQHAKEKWIFLWTPWLKKKKKKKKKKHPKNPRFFWKSKNQTLGPEWHKNQGLSAKGGNPSQTIPS